MLKSSDISRRDFSRSAAICPILVPWLLGGTIHTPSANAQAWFFDDIPKLLNECKGAVRATVIAREGVKITNRSVIVQVVFKIIEIFKPLPYTDTAYEPVFGAEVFGAEVFGTLFTLLTPSRTAGKILPRRVYEVGSEYLVPVGGSLFGQAVYLPVESDAFREARLWTDELRKIVSDWAVTQE